MEAVLPAFPIELRGRSKCLRTFFSLKDAQLDAGSNSGWAHVAMLGEWDGHSKGSFAFTQEAFSQILKNFSAQSNPIPWDYEHDTFSAVSTGPKPASGWIKRLELRNNGTELWAYVDWTQRAAQMIRDGEYRFCSPVVDFESIDRKSNEPIGAELLSVALTNNPFLDGQQPLKLTWTAAAEPKGAPQQPPPVPAMAAPPHVDAIPPPPPAATDPDAADDALGDGSDADASALLNVFADASGLDRAQTLAALMDLKDFIVNALQRTVGKDGTSAEQATRTMTVEKKPDPTSAAPPTTPITTTTSAPTTPATVTTAAAPGGDGLTLDALERENDKALIERMKKRLDAIEAERAEEKKQAIAQLVDEKIATGHVLVEQRENAIWAFTQDRARAEQIYAHQVVSIGQRQSQTATAPTGAAHGASDAEVIDVSQFSRGELMTIDCLIGAHKTQAQAVAIVLKQRGQIKS